MSFSFNWAGMSVPQGTRRDTSDRAIQAAGMWGQAAGGYQRMGADDEYAGMLKEFGNARQSIAALTEELNRLKARNAEIAKQLGL